MTDYPHFDGVESCRGFSFSKYSTYGCGGTADIAYFPLTEADAFGVFDGLKSQGLPFTVLGNCSDILAADGNYGGAVISTRRLSGIRPEKEGVYVYSGTVVSDLLSYCIDNSLGGVEYLAGIPATVGGLAFMNGGARSRYIGDNIISVTFYDGKINKLSKNECNFGYKHSTMRDINCMITGVLLDLYPQTPKLTRKKISSVLQARASQPKGRSCGCVFKNPYGLSAGKLIEEAGLKGLKEGAAYVSREHANFIINGGGCAADVYRLIKSVKKKVFDFSGVELEEEVVYIGDFK